MGAHAEHATENKGFFQRFKGVIILLIILLVVSFFCGWLPFLNLPTIQSEWLGIPQAVSPVVQLPAENLTEEPLLDLPGEYSDIYLTNTLVALFAADALLILLAVLARIGLREVPSGISNLFEMLVEFLFNLSEQVVGAKWGPKIFPFAATIFMLILAANWMHFIPGVDSIGLLHHATEGHEGYAVEELSWLPNAYYLNPSAAEVEAAAEAPIEALSEAVAEPEEGAGEEAHAEEGPCTENCTVTPFMRAATTDINLPLGLAIVAFVVIQAFGLLGLGGWYVAKFINTPGLARGGMGIMDFGVGLFELVLEPVKIISLTFRLLGNIFGGGILLIVVSTLIPFLLPVGLYLFELFVGAIQAYVFAMLTLVFSAMAMVGHGGDH